MRQRTFISVFIFLSAIVATGCTTNGSIGMDGRVSNLNDLADRMIYKYNGLTYVKNSRPNLKHHRHYGDFAMTLFNVRATKNDVPDMVNTFRNYCSYIGGFQRDVGANPKKPNSFSIICEPREIYGKVRDPAYFLFFVNVLLSPSSSSHINANVADKSSVDKRESADEQKTVPYHTHPDHTHPNYGHPHKTNFDTTDWRGSNSDNANHQSKFLLKTHHQHPWPSTAIPPSTYQGHKHHGYENPNNVYGRYSGPYITVPQKVNPYYQTPRNINPYYKAPRSNTHYHTVPHHKKAYKAKVPQHKKVYKAKAPGVCVNFLISENQTHHTVFTHMPNYENYRKRFEAVLESTKSFC